MSRAMHGQYVHEQQAPSTQDIICGLLVMLVFLVPLTLTIVYFCRASWICEGLTRMGLDPSILRLAAVC